jgi:hypothetical protein
MNIPGALVVGGKSISSYSSLADWKADLTQQAAAFTASAANTQTALSVAPAAAADALGIHVTLSTSATTAANPTVALPTLENAPVTNASIALAVLLKAQADDQKPAVAGPATEKDVHGSSHHSSLQSSPAPQPNATQQT